MKWRGAICLMFVGCASRAHLPADETPSAVKGYNQVAPAENDLFHPPVRLTAEDGVIDSGSAWGHSGPWVEDVDGDLAKDLIVGDFSGLFKFYRNLGTSEQPRYAQGVNLQAGGVDAEVPIY